MKGLNINPVSRTALVTLDYISQTTIPYGKELAEIHHIDQIHPTLSLNEGFNERYRVYPSKIEIRLGGTEKIIRREGNPYILDIACGFTPRGLYMSKEGFHYIGVDLPFVIEQMKPSIDKVTQELVELVECRERINYVIADATNGAQLDAAVSHVSGPITITCEGLLGYMPAYEQKEVAENIYKILSNHGGVWITPDYNSVFEDESHFTINFVFRGVTDRPLAKAASNTKEQSLKMLLDIGFSIEEYTYRPDFKDISALRNLSEDEKISVYNDALNCQECTYIILKCKNK